MARAPRRGLTVSPPRHVGRREIALASAVFLAVTLAMFGDVFAAGGRRILSHESDDLARFFFHWWQFSFAELGRGNFPLWNPHLYAGTPYFGAFQPALLYPPHWVHLILPAAPAFNLEFALHLWLAGMGVFLWTAHRRLDIAACLLAGVVFMFCGAFFLQLYRGHLPNFCTMVWAPFILLAIDRILDATPSAETRVRVRWVSIGAAAVALQIFAGHVQYVFYTAIIAGLYALLRWSASRRPLADATALVSVYAAGATLAAVQLAAGLDAVAESVRTTLRYDVARTFAFPPENLATLIMPDVFGDMVHTPYWGRWTLSETSVFVGAAALMLAACGAVHGAQQVRRFSGTMLVVALILAVGYATPLYALLYAYVPGFASFRGITKFTFLASLFLVMLVAIGFDYLRTTATVPRWPAVAALASGVALLAGGLAVRAACASDGAAPWRQALASVDFTELGFRFFIQGRAPGSLQSCVTAGTALLRAGATFLLLAALFFGIRRDRRVLYAVAVVAAVEVFTHARAMRPTFDPAPLDASSEALRRSLDRRGDPDGRVLAANPNVAMSAGAFDVWGEDPMVLERYGRFVARTQDTTPDSFLAAPGLRFVSPLLALVRLRYLFDAGGRAGLSALELRALPRATLVTRWTRVPHPDAALAAITDPGFDPLHTVVLEADPDPLPNDAGAVGRVSVTDVSTDVLDVRAELTAPAILLITDNYSRGWHVDPVGSASQRYEVMPADYFLRAIPLGAGNHHLRLAYRPAAFVAGKWITIAALCVFAAVWLMPRSPRGR